MSVEPEIALVGCMPCATQEATTPSDVVLCDKCGTELWMSRALLGALATRGYAPEDIKALCLYTCIVVHPDTELELTEEQRAELHKRGLTDAQVDEGVAFASQIIQREEEGEFDAGL